MKITQIMATDYCVWVGECSYDTRPYAISAEGKFIDHAPVAYTVAFANIYLHGYSVPAFDIAAWMESLPKNARIITPDYSGCHFRGEWVHDAHSGEFIDYFFDADADAEEIIE